MMRYTMAKGSHLLCFLCSCGYLISMLVEPRPVSSPFFFPPLESPGATSPLIERFPILMHCASA